MVRLRLLGGATLEIEGEALSGPAAHRHTLALLALLACAPATALSRSKLVGFLWPDSPEDTARNRLGTTVHRIRRQLGDDVLLSHGQDLQLNRTAIDTDVFRFRSALDAGDPAAAVREYQGRFMDGFWLRGSHEFERWLEAEQERLRFLYQDALENLATLAEERGAPAEAAAWLRDRWREDPYDSRIVARLMAALAAAGNRLAALDVARRHARLLHEDLGTVPPAEIGRLERALVDPTPGGAGEQPAPGPWQETGSIAVLPFETVGEGDAGAFADGLHHDLLTRLARVEGLHVISRTSVLRFRGADTPIPVIARELGVASVLEGAIQHAGERVRLSVQLIDGSEDVHRWAETYDEELTAANLFDIQSELAERIARSLQARLSPEERMRIRDWAPTRDLEAYRLHAQGRARLDERTEAGMRRAVEHFESAIERDPDYALAWVGLADALTLLHEYGYEPSEPALSGAARAARRAVRLDGNLAEAHASLGLLHEARKEGPAALRELERAVDLQPGYAEAQNWLSWTNQLLGRPETALDSARRAVALNPLSPEAVSNLAISLLINRQLDDALLEARRARELQPGWNTPVFYEALALFDLERFREAGHLLQDLSVPWAGSGPLATLALVYARTRRAAEARELRDRFAATNQHVAIGVIEAASGDPGAAFQAFEAAETWDYWPTLTIHHYYPGILDTLRSRAPYADLRARAFCAWGLKPDGRLPE